MKTIEEIICMREDELQEYIVEFITLHDIPFVRTKDYIVTTKFNPKLTPLVCIHTDTVSLNPLNPKFINNTNGVLSTCSPFKCLGADDRAGIWIALKMIEEGTVTDFEYGFFAGEERGAIGSSAFSFDYDLNRFSCFIGLDRASRQGVQNVALYGYDNDELTKIFVDFGFVKQYGSFTDCSTLAAATQDFPRACINLSVGYQFEHTAHEVLYLELMEDTLEVMLGVEIPEKVFDYVYSPRTWGKFGGVHTGRSIWEDWDYTEEAVYTLEEDEYTSMALVCDLCSAHERLYEFQGSYVCRECLDLCKVV